MSASAPSRVINIDEDILYRKIDPEHWATQTNSILPVAFEDPGKPYTNLSFFVKRFMSPEQVLEYFANFSATVCATNTPAPVPTRTMYACGYRIAQITTKQIHDMGLSFVPGKDGNEISSKGHVNVADGQKHAIRFLRVCKNPLTEEDTFSIS